LKFSSQQCQFRYDLSDLVEKLLWLQSHDEEAKAIALNGVAFAHRNMTASIKTYFRILFAASGVLVYLLKPLNFGEFQRF